MGALRRDPEDLTEQVPRRNAARSKGVLRAIRQKHGAVAHEAIFGPILREIDRQKPVPPRRPVPDRQDGPDPLTAAIW